MDERIKQLVDMTAEKFSLDNYYLAEHNINRDVELFQETIYTLSMEWLPEGEKSEEEGLNPPGSAIIELDIHNERYLSVIFVMEKTLVEQGIAFNNDQVSEAIAWVEAETGLVCGRDVEVERQDEHSVTLQANVDGIRLSPAPTIRVKWDEAGRLTLYSFILPTAMEQKLAKEAYTLNIADIKPIVEERLQLTHLPSFAEEKLNAVYGIEEVYVSNKDLEVKEINLLERPFVTVNERMEYEAEEVNFVEQELDLLPEVTVEAAFSKEPSPELEPITEAEKDACRLAVKRTLQAAFPNDSSKWLLKSLHREEHYIHATLTEYEQGVEAFKRKLAIFIDGETLEAVNYLDNGMMLEMLSSFTQANAVTVMKEEAYEKLEGFFELTPVYVYDFAVEGYVLCGKLDCNYAVDASSGEVVSLDDL